MPLRQIVSMALLGAVCLTGCGLMDSGRTAWSPLPNPEDDYRDSTEEESPSWVQNAGREARGDRRRERDPDSWWGKYIISEKHRDIDRNFGIDY